MPGRRRFLQHWPDDPSLRQVDASDKKWVILTDPAGEPMFVLDSHHLLRDALFNELSSDPTTRPIMCKKRTCAWAMSSGGMKVTPEWSGDNVIEDDLILVWGDQKRIITGADLLGRLLRGIATVEARQSA